MFIGSGRDICWEDSKGPWGGSKVDEMGLGGRMSDLCVDSVKFV